GPGELAPLREGLLGLGELATREQLGRAADALELAERLERAGVERVDRAARRALEAVLEISAGGERADSALQRADADLRQRSDLEERQRAGERSACRTGEDALPVLALGDGGDGADAGPDHALH